jgi:hypothetical protein
LVITSSFFLLLALHVDGATALLEAEETSAFDRSLAHEVANRLAGSLDRCHHRNQLVQLGLVRVCTCHLEDVARERDAGVLTHFREDWLG